MKGKILGISLSVLGVIALIITLIGINGIVSATQVNMLLAGGVAGTVLFFAGIWLSGRPLVTTQKQKTP
jgi:DMSO reductase anchor subunit